MRLLSYSFQTRKDTGKFIRSVIELAVLVFLLIVIVRAWTGTKVYAPFSPDEVSAADKGFICVSYPIVDRAGNREAVGADGLDDQLKALYQAGYRTVTQRDIIHYYKSGNALPDRALLLLFEDGSREAAVFAEAAMEKYNFKATMLSYANSFSKNDQRLLTRGDFNRMLGGSFWEAGTSGYRMEYINVFDRDGNYLGEMEPSELTSLAGIGDYDHFLMDFIRDESGLPKETYGGMCERVSGEYLQMKEVYEREIGQMPGLYALVNPNTGAFGHNGKVSAINEENILRLFNINMNRLGQAFNDRKISVYDLTRTQVQPYWRTNHLLMRIAADTVRTMDFVTGDAEKAGEWTLAAGAAEFCGDEIVLTSQPDGIGRLELGQGVYSDLDIAVRLRGVKLGAQSLLLRTDERLGKGIEVGIKDDVFYISETADGISETLLETDLGDGAVGLGEPGDYQLAVTLRGDKLSARIDGNVIATDIEVAAKEGRFGLRAETSLFVRDPRKPVDNIYDGVFEGLVITQPDSEQPVYDGRPGGLEAAADTAADVWKAIVDWFIMNF